MSANKREFAMACGADHFIISSSPADMTSGAGSLDLILNTVPVYHDYMAYRPLLQSAGKQVMLGRD
jgi:uncharacterized zinc-type alcohol dehydrogenase-like protein